MGHSNSTYVGTGDFQKCGLCFENRNYLPQDDEQGIPESYYEKRNFDQSEV